jgi:phospholipid/cholesterol/gamma-HCH transport system substrate-binding protein
VKRRNEIVVGTVILLSLVLIVVGTVWMKGTGFGREERTLKARVPEAGQLLKGAKVKLRGVGIGRVDAIELEQGSAGNVIVTMKIDPKISLPEDPVALLSPESMFGDWQVQIFPRSSFPQYPYAEAPDPNVIPGYSLPDISRLTAVADQIAGNLAKLSERFEEAFTRETAANVRDAIENIQKVSEQLTGLISRQQRNADEVATSLAQTSEALGGAAETANRAFAEFEAAVGGGKLSGIVANVQKTSVTADSLSRVLLKTTQDLRIAAASADTAFKSVGDIAQRVNRGEGTLGMLVRDTAMYFRVIETNAEIQALLRDMRANPRKYINLRVF